MITLKNNLKITHFVLLVSALNFLLFHIAFFTFVFNNLDYKSSNSIVIIGSLVLLMFIANAFIFYLFCSFSTIVGKFFLIAIFISNAIATYFVNTYGVIIDESMISNVLNTKYSEASSFFSIKFVLYLALLGILPSIFIFKTKIIKDTWKTFFIKISIIILFIAGMAYANAKNWLWIDQNSKVLGGLAMPWSYSVNLFLFYVHEKQKNEKETLLPDATIADNEKSVVVLVIGESARSKNFSLYGYSKNTNPKLSTIPNVSFFNANSLATYTTAGVKAILNHKKTNKLYEILPNYLYRNNVDVVWRTTNWGEPPLHIKNYQTADSLRKQCQSFSCDYDEILLTALKEQIQKSKKNKTLIVLHSSTSHGPVYSKKYPPQFEIFKPVCNSAALSNCSQTDLINAYDNTIVYTDYILAQVIETLQLLKEYKSAMIFVSDHGESLGEKNLYMHGVPLSIAPKEQFEIPFIVWVSDSSKHLKPLKKINQNFVFHSVLNFLNLQSPIYKEELNIFK